MRISVLGGSCIWLRVQALTASEGAYLRSLRFGWSSKSSKQGGLFAQGLACHNVRMSVLGGSCISLGVQALTSTEGAHLQSSFWSSKSSEQGGFPAHELAYHNARISVLGGSCISLGVYALTSSEGAHLQS